MRFPIIFLTRVDGNGQIVFAWGDRAIVSCPVCAIGVIGFIEIEHHDAAGHFVYRAVDVTASAVGVDTAGRIGEGNEKVVARGSILHQCLRLVDH